jgi:DNA repair protein SbcC/Rad50
MKLIKLEYKNFNSYGNKITKIEFNEKGNMIMLIGQSGHGKSTIREVISYLIYGKVQEKKLGDLPNRINKTLWGKITLVAKGSTITIERGITPKVLEVYIDGVVQDVAGNSNIQGIIENDYMKIPQSTFDNVISISVDKFKSFLTMRPSDKRKILDQIFGILFFNKIHDSLKEFVKDFNVDIGNLGGQVRVLMENKKTIEEKIKSLDAEKSKDITDKLEEVIENINSLTESMLEMVENSKDIDSKASLAFEKMTKLTKTKNEYSFKIKDCNHKLKVYDSDVCPTCNSDLTDDVHTKNKEKIREEKLQYENDLKGVKVSIDKLKGIQSIIDKKKQVLGNTIYETRLALDKLKGKQENLSKPKVETNEFDSVLENTIEKIDLILIAIQEKKKDEYLYAELSKIFGEDGVKLQIMKNFLPSFNKSINEISKKLHFPYKVEIDERFNSKLISIGEEINPKTLSTGERKKADFAVLISLIHIMKRNYPNINLLFLDEILASLDANSIHEVLLLIRNVVDDLDLTVFVINHSELPKEMFDYIYAVNKVAGFSELLIDEC